MQDREGHEEGAKGAKIKDNAAQGFLDAQIQGRQIRRGLMHADGRRECRIAKDTKRARRARR